MKLLLALWDKEKRDNLGGHSHKTPNYLSSLENIIDNYEVHSSTLRLVSLTYSGTSFIKTSSPQMTAKCERYVPLLT